MRPSFASFRWMTNRLRLSPDREVIVQWPDDLSKAEAARLARALPALAAFIESCCVDDKSLATPVAEGTDGARSSAAPDVRAVAVTEPAQGGGDWAALGSASTEEPTT